MVDASRPEDGAKPGTASFASHACPGRVAIASVVATALFVAWAWSPIARSPQAPPSASPRPATGVAVAEVERGPAPDIVSRQAAAPPTAAPAPAPGARVCGLQDVDGGARIPQARRDAALALQDAMAASPDERTQAAGLLLQMRAAHGPEAAPMATAADAPLHGLADLAARSSEPAVIAIALEACAERPAACGAAAPARWAELEPANAAPWLLLAHEAEASGDDAALAAAVARIAQASTLDWHDGDLAERALRAIPPGASALERTLDVHAIAGAREDWAAPAYDGLVAWCTDDDRRRAPACDAAAQLLVRHASRPAEARLGARLGRDLGWPAQRLQALRLQRDALGRAGAGLVAADDYGCAATRRLRDQLVLQQRLGDAGATRALLDRTGHPFAEAVDALRRARAARGGGPAS